MHLEEKQAMQNEYELISKELKEKDLQLKAEKEQRDEGE